MATHQVGEPVLVLDPATLTRVSSLDEVGLSRFYRAVSIGSDPSLPEAVAREPQALRAGAHPGQPQRRRPHHHLVRRTRYSGEWRDLVDVPLNEASEAYEADVFNGAGQVVRTLSSSSPSVIYTAADQTTDFGESQSAIDIALYQL